MLPCLRPIVYFETVFVNTGVERAVVVLRFRGLCGGNKQLANWSTTAAAFSQLNHHFKHNEIERSILSEMLVCRSRAGMTGPSFSQHCHHPLEHIFAATTALY